MKSIAFVVMLLAALTQLLNPSLMRTPFGPY